MRDFDGVRALVTGGASGIGLATAQRLAADGASVAVLDLAEDGPDGFVYAQADVTDDAAVRSAVASAVDTLGGLDVLVNNAGIGAQGGIEANDDDEWRRVLDVNVLGLVRVTRAALPELRKSSRAAIVNTCSIVATAGLPNRALYSASKGAVLSLTLAMAADLISEGIRVNAVNPGTADTAWVGRLLDSADDPAAERSRAGGPATAWPAGLRRRGRRRDRLPRLTGVRLDDGNVPGRRRRDVRAPTSTEELTVRRSACVVIGAGAAGLAASTALADAGVDHVVLERRGVADTWLSQRWDAFRLNTPGWMNTMLGPVTPNSFSARDEVVHLLADRARALPVRCHTPVQALDHDGTDFVVHTAQERIQAATVVIATGLQNVARVPAVKTYLPARLRHLHTADYAQAGDLDDGAVLVVGSAQSGCQIAEDLALAGRRVYLATSKVGRYAWTYRGRELIGWLVDCGHWDQQPADLLDPSDTRAAIAVVGSGGHSLDLRVLARLGVTLLGHLESVRGERLAFTDSLLENIAYADTVATLLEAKADAYIAQRGIDAPAADSAAGEAFEPDVITELHLAAAGITNVIWATGFTGDLSWVRLPILDDRGDPLHDRCASPVPGLWYIGFPWLTRRQSGILFGMPVDAAEVTAGVVRHLAARSAS